jgi:hypothetical protein
MNLKKLNWLATLVVILTLALPWTAFADDIWADGDGITPVANNDMTINVCANTPTTANALIAVRRNGNANNNANNNVFQNGTNVTVTIDSYSGAFTPSLSGDTTVSLPSNWQSQSAGTMSTDTVTAVISLPATATSGNGTVRFKATGVNNANAANVQFDNMAVTWNVVSCDTTDPVVTVPAPITAEATSPTGAVVTFTATATDETAPANPAVTCSPASGSTFPIATTTVTCSATDAAGNTGSASFTVTVQDTTPPTITGTPGDISLEALGATTVVNYTNPTATDIVDGAVAVSCVPGSGSAFPVGTSTIVCAATDTRGNSASTSFSVTINDTTAPVLVVPSDITEEATGPSGAVVNYTASASDLVDGDVTPVCSPASGTTFAIGPTSVNCTATDTAGNSSSASFNVTVQDTTKPVVIVPADIVEEATGPAGAAVSFSVTASDAVGVVSLTCAPASGSTFPLGATIVNCSATDAAGNTGYGSFTVTVEDTTPPVVTVPGNITEEATGPGGAVVTFSATAVDLVDGSVPVVCVPASGSVFPLGATQVDCTATDAAGNTSEPESFAVFVVDTTPPTVTVPANIVAEATGPSGAAVTYSGESATDIVDGSVPVTCVPVSGSTFPLSTTTVTCSATDAAGNTGSNSFTVTVQDTTAPTVTVPADITAEATGPSGAAVTYSGESATDIVDGSVPVTCAPASGSTFALGTTTVTCSATDAAGNTGSNSFSVTVQDTTAPVITWVGGPASGGSYYYGSVPAAPTCTAVDLVSGNVACNVTGYSAAVGAHTMTASATDGAGNTATSTRSYTVLAWTLKGFYQPVDMNGVYNTVKGGSTVPLKFEVFAGPTELTDVSVVKSFVQTKIACNNTSPVDEIEVVSTGGTSLRYDTTGGQFIQNWKTPTGAGTCYRVTMTTQDGSSLVALFKLK